jgi:superfamily II DNA helicase RecQ
MPLHFFTIPVFHPQPAQDELNHFLATHRVVRLEKQWLPVGEQACWALCVETAEGPGPLPASLTVGGRSSSSAAAGGKGKVDWREQLSADEFEVFARLRALRKAVAERDGLPPYAVFTNEQLAAMVRRRVVTATALGQIDGIGPARVERYAATFLAPLLDAYGAPAGAEGA